MARRPRSLLLSVVLLPVLACAAALVGCEAGAAPCRRCPSAVADAGTGDGGAEADEIVSLRVEPMSAELVVGDVPASLALHAIARTRRGEDVDIPVNWTLSRSGIATIGTDGVVSADGRMGGEVRASAEATVGGVALRGLASLTVRVRRTMLVGTTTDDADAFDADPALPLAGEEAGILYPLDGAVMPANVLPPDVMWLRGGEGEVARVMLRRSHVTIAAVVRSTDRRWTVDAGSWATIVRTDPDEPLVITVDRSTGAGIVGSDPVDVRLAASLLPGSAYYWSIGEGTIVRVDDDDRERHDVIPHAPLVREATGEATRCVGCHVISPSGRWMAASMGNGFGAAGARVGAVFDLTRDLSGDPAPTVFRTDTYTTSATWTQAAWSPDERRLVAESEMRLHFVDPFSGGEVRPSAGAFPDVISVQPDWSPTGAAIAFVRASSWTVDFQHGDLAVLDVVGDDALGAERVLHRGADLAGAPEGGEADSYPSFAPDGSAIAFAHGTTSFSTGGTGALYLIGLDGSGLARLDHVSSGGDAFAPRFAPFASEGIAWLAFHSRRAYGNVREGGRDGEHGVWITAIHLDAAPGEDPSSVPYWLPGQDPTTSNISVAWARRPCRADGAACASGSECCGGACSADADGAGVCIPASACRENGQTCGASADCCTGGCFEHVCLEEVW